MKGKERESTCVHLPALVEHTHKHIFAGFIFVYTTKRYVSKANARQTLICIFCMFIKYDFSLVLKYAQSGMCISTLRLSSVDYAFEALERKAKCGKNSLNLISNGLLRIYMYLYVHLVSVVVMVVDCSRTE